MATKKTTKTTKKAAPKKTAPKAKPATKATTKSTVKTSAKTTTPVKNNAIETKPKAQTTAQPETKTATPKQSVKVKRAYLLLALAIVAIGALLYFGRSLFVAAVVNGQPISRYEIVTTAEKQSGKQALTTQVRYTLIEQEAKKQNVTVTDQEAEAEVKKIEDSVTKQGQDFEQVLALQGMTREDAKKALTLELKMKKMVGKDIKVSDKEVNDYFEKNKEMLPQDENEADLKKSIAERLKQEKLAEKLRVWLEDLEKKANVIYFVQY